MHRFNDTSQTPRSNEMNILMTSIGAFTRHRDSATNMRTFGGTATTA